MLRICAYILAVISTCSAVMLSASTATAQYWQATAGAGLAGKVTSLAIAGNRDMFAGTISGALSQPAGVYRSTNNGASWVAMQSSSESPLGPVWGIDAKDEVFLGGYPGEYFTSNYGATWQEFRITPDVGSDPVISSFAIAPFGHMFISSQGADLFATTNFDSAWYDQGVFSDGFDYPTFVWSSPQGTIISGTTTLLAVANGIDGETWTTLNGAPAFGMNVSFAYFENGWILEGGTGGLNLSTQNGLQWTPINTPPGATGETAYSLAVGADSSIFAGLSTGGMYVSTDLGANWMNIDSGLTSNTVNALAINRDGILFAATNHGIFQYLTPTGGVKAGNNQVPFLTLSPASPNPVSSETSIQFTIPQDGPISLSVFDVTGRQVATLASGFYASGGHVVLFDGHALPDGAYYYRLEASGQSASRMFVIEH